MYRSSGYQSVPRLLHRAATKKTAASQPTLLIRYVLTARINQSLQNSKKKVVQSMHHHPNL
jgi:hypothetical protein